MFGFAARIERLSASICMAISVCWDWNVRALSFPPLSLLTRAMAVSPSALNRDMQLAPRAPRFTVLGASPLASAKEFQARGIQHDIRRPLVRAGFQSVALSFLPVHQVGMRSPVGPSRASGRGSWPRWPARPASSRQARACRRPALLRASWRDQARSCASRARRHRGRRRWRPRRASRFPDCEIHA